MTAIDDLTRLRHMRDAAREILEFMKEQSRESQGNRIKRIEKKMGQ